MRPIPLRRHRGFWLLSLLVPVALLALGINAGAAYAQTNLLTNGSFSTGSTAGWTCSSGDTLVTSPVYSGSSYALAGTPAGSDDAQCSQVVSVQPNSAYTLTGWVEGDYVFLGDSGTGTSDTDDDVVPVTLSPVGALGADPPPPPPPLPAGPSSESASA